MFARLSFVLVAGIGLAFACGSDDDDTTGAGGAAGKGGSGGTAGAPGGMGGEGGETQSPLVARGDYLVNHVAACSDCHTPRDAMGVPDFAKFLSGAECFGQLPNGHCLHTRNLTNDETGLKNRTDDEIKTMIKDGIRPTATGDEALFPAMPYYVFHNMRDEDLDAIVAYLRTVPAVEHAVPRSDEEFRVPGAAAPIDPELIPMPADDYPERASALRGRYLAGQVGICMECHTQHTMDPAMLLDMDKVFAGGEEFDIGLPTVPISKNLTSDSDTGLGEWEAADIVKVLKEGKDKNGDGICPPMPVGPMGPFGGLTDADALDIANFIKSLPPIVNEIDDVCVFPPQ
jgi:mono/diheme cytochrome c family protein